MVMRCLPLLLLFLSCTGPADRVEKKVQVRIPMIIDADTANEVDDLFALVGAIAHTSPSTGKYDLLGITSAQFHTSPLASVATVLESQAINEEIVGLMNRPDIKTPLGSNLPLANDSVPAISEASTFIVNQAKTMPAGEKLQVFILGSCTNVASAILQDPSIIPMVHVRYLGFWHNPETNVYDKKEFNSGNDTFAVNVLLNTPDLEFTVMTATTSQHLVFDRLTTEANLSELGPISNYLLHRWDNYDRWWTEEDPEKQRWIMWDIASLEAFFLPELASLESRLTPPENTSREIGVYTQIKHLEMEQVYWETVQRALR